jgi:cytochrome c oxidase cbb3-type subunit 3
MNGQFEDDNIEALEAKETRRVLPLGWQLLFWGLILWGIYYTVSYTPALSGWSQENAFTQSMQK